MSQPPSGVQERLDEVGRLQERYEELEEKLIQDMLALDQRYLGYFSKPLPGPAGCNRATAPG